MRWWSAAGRNRSSCSSVRAGGRRAGCMDRPRRSRPERPRRSSGSSSPSRRKPDVAIGAPTSDAEAGGPVGADAPLVSIRHLKTYYPIRGSFGARLLGREAGYVKAVDDVSLDLRARGGRRPRGRIGQWQDDARTNHPRARPRDLRRGDLRRSRDHGHVRARAASRAPRDAGRLPGPSRVPEPRDDDRGVGRPPAPDPQDRQGRRAAPPGRGGSQQRLASRLPSSTWTSTRRTSRGDRSSGR